MHPLGGLYPRAAKAESFTSFGPLSLKPPPLLTPPSNKDYSPDRTMSLIDPQFQYNVGIQQPNGSIALVSPTYCATSATAVELAALYGDLGFPCNMVYGPPFGDWPVNLPDPTTDPENPPRPNPFQQMGFVPWLMFNDAAQSKNGLNTKLNAGLVASIWTHGRSDDYCKKSMVQEYTFTRDYAG